MFLLENIVLDFNKNQLCFPVDNEEFLGGKGKNMFWFQNRLFARLGLNHLPIMTFIDSGSNCFMEINRSDPPNLRPYLALHVHGQAFMGRRH